MVLYHDSTSPTVIAWKPPHRAALPTALKLKLLQAAVSLHSNRASLQFQLGVELYNNALFEQALNPFYRALDLEPKLPEAYTWLGNSLVQLGRHEEGIQAYTKALRIQPAHALTHCYLGKTLLHLQRNEEGLKALQAATRYDPTALQPFVLRARFLLANGNLQEAITNCEAAFKLKSWDPEVLSTYIAALSESGDTETAHSLADSDRLMRMIDLPTPAVFRDITDFNRSLAAEIRDDPSLAYEPAGLATHNGSQTDSFTYEKGRTIEVLEHLIKTSIVDYCASLTPQHPFTAGKPSSAAINLWAVILEKGGYQEPHIHPNSWLSGVYYVKQPRAMTSLDKQHHGWIEFHRPPKSLYCRRLTQLTLRCPQEGRLLLFPSYFFHSTIPTATDEERICIAFSMVDCAEKPSHMDSYSHTAKTP